MIYAGYVKVTPVVQQTGQLKLKFSPGTGEAKFSLSEGKKSIESGFTESVTEGNLVPRVRFPFRQHQEHGLWPNPKQGVRESRTSDSSTQAQKFETMVVVNGY